MIGNFTIILEPLQAESNNRRWTKNLLRFVHSREILALFAKELGVILLQEFYLVVVSDTVREIF